MAYKSKHIICDCKSAEHHIVISFDDEYYEEAVINVYLSTYKNFFQRVWTAIKYIVCYHGSYGQYDEIILNKEEALALEQELKSYRTRKSHVTN